MKKDRKAWSLALLIGCIAAISMGSAFAEKTYTLPIDLSFGKKLNQKYLVSKTEYKDPTIHVKMSSGRYKNRDDYWVARITIKHPSQLRTAAAGNFQSYSEMDGVRLAQRVNAVVAVDGDYFFYTGGTGFMVRQGKLIFNKLTGDRDVLLIDEDGDFHISHMPKAGELSMKIKGKKVINALCFGPALVENGKAIYNPNYGESYAADKNRQRMAIAQVGPLEYLCVCIGSPIRGSTGMTLREFADFVATFHVQTAYNLDGGDSTMMVFNGAKFNDVTSTNLRKISDIVYFASAYPGS